MTKMFYVFATRAEHSFHLVLICLIVLLKISDYDPHYVLIFVLPLRCKHSPQQFVLKHPQWLFFTRGEDQLSRLIKPLRHWCNKTQYASLAVIWFYLVTSRISYVSIYRTVLPKNFLYDISCGIYHLWLIQLENDLNRISSHNSSGLPLCPCFKGQLFGFFNYAGKSLLMRAEDGINKWHRNVCWIGWFCLNVRRIPLDSCIV